MSDRTCALCGQPITALDNTVSYYDEFFNYVEFHAACKLKQSEEENGEEG